MSVRIAVVVASGFGLAFPVWGAAGQSALPEDATDVEIAAYRALQADRVGYEREIKRLRGRFFRGIRGTEVRQVGMRRMRAYTDPAAFPLLTELLFPEGEDVRDAVLDHLAGLRTDEADAAIAWEAVYGADESDRAASLGTLERVRDERGVSRLVEDVVRSGLREPDPTIPIEATRAAASLGLFDLIPIIAQAQVASRGGERQGDLAWIMVGTQRAFVSDVQPIVADGAVAFDPQLSVVSEGTILRVSDAFVAVYRVEVHEILVGMTSEAWGQPTGHLGYDVPAWGRWYRDAFEPFLRAQAEAGDAGSTDAQP
jgi:hypothetical protein